MNHNPQPRALFVLKYSELGGRPELHWSGKVPFLPDHTHASHTKDIQLFVEVEFNAHLKATVFRRFMIDPMGTRLRIITKKEYYEVFEHVDASLLEQCLETGIGAVPLNVFTKYKDMFKTHVVQGLHPIYYWNNIQEWMEICAQIERQFQAILNLDIMGLPASE